MLLPQYEWKKHYDNPTALRHDLGLPEKIKLTSDTWVNCPGSWLYIRVTVNDGLTAYAWTGINPREEVVKCLAVRVQEHE